MKRLLTKWYKAMKAKFNLLMFGQKAMERWREKIYREQIEEKKSDEEKKEVEGTENRRRAKASAHLREREKARLQKSDPAELIEKVKDMWVKHCNTITNKDLGKDKGEEDKRLRKAKELVLDTGSRACDIFDVCAVSFFRNVRAAASRPFPVHVVSFSLDILLPMCPVPCCFDCMCRSFTQTSWTIPVRIAS